MNKDDRTLLTAFQDRLEQVEDHIIVFNRELGILCGKMTVLVWLIRGTLLVVIGAWLYDIYCNMV